VANILRSYIVTTKHGLITRAIEFLAPLHIDFLHELAMCTVRWRKAIDRRVPGTALSVDLERGRKMMTTVHSTLEAACPKGKWVVMMSNGTRCPVRLNYNLTWDKQAPRCKQPFGFPDRSSVRGFRYFNRGSNSRLRRRACLESRAPAAMEGSYFCFAGFML
jgi:hypothetical protein